ncbi:MAG: cupin domain-containing protein [Desulfobacter sp.]
MKYTSVNINEKFSKFTEHWSPKVIAEMNDIQFKVIKVQGEFVWHEHKDTDEVFMVFQGVLEIKFRDGSVSLSPGEMFVVPKGVAHKPVAEQECRVMVIEPKGVKNTGNTDGELTADNDVWI